MNILIAGYAYIKKNYLKTFQFYPELEAINFLLPKVWKAKGGKLQFVPPQRSNIFTAKACFYHSNYPIIGGLLKGWMPAFPFVLFKLSHKINMVYSPSEPILLTTLYQGFWSKFFGKKHIVFTWENIAYEDKFKGFNLLIKKIILKLNLIFCDGVICGNQKAKDIFKKYTDKPVAAIPLSGVDTDFYVKESGPTPKDKLIYTFAGALGYRKGVHNVIEALKIVLESISNAHLNIVGTGEYEENLKLKVKNLNLEENITFIPWANAEELKNIFSQSDIFVYPSLSHEGWEEQFGYSMAEASLMNLPVITTKTGSIEEVVVDGKTGILINPDNKEELTGAMIKLAQDNKLRIEMGENGRKYIIEHYGYGVVARKFYEFFKSI